MKHRADIGAGAGVEVDFDEVGEFPVEETRPGTGLVLSARINPVVMAAWLVERASALSPCDAPRFAEYCEAMQAERPPPRIRIKKANLTP